MKSLLSICLLLATSLVVAQEKYRIQYDYKTDIVDYFKIDKNNKIIDTLEKPKFKRNSLVEIKLLNVNPFAVKIETDVKEEELHASSTSGFNFSNLMGGMSSMSDTDLGLNVNATKAASLGGTKNSSRGANINNKFTALNSMHNNIDALNKSLIADLTNPNLDKEQILESLKSVASLQQDARISDPKANFHVYIASMKNVLQVDANSVASDLTEITDEMNSSNADKQPASRGELVAQNIAFTNLKSMLTSLENSTHTSASKLSKVEDMYSSLEASSFEQTYDYEISSDKVNIELKFLQSEFSDSYDDDDTETTLKTRNLKLFSKGGFKINTSIAFTLNNYKSKSKNFYIDDSGLVGAEDNTHFIPNLSTMINFYPVIGENINIGASFGLSIPVSDDVKGVNYLFGPSIFLGNKSRLALSGGVAYGPVKKLTNGIEVGDTTFFNDVDSFTKNVYEFGYYFGISFSIFNLK